MVTQLNYFTSSILGWFYKGPLQPPPIIIVLPFCSIVATVWDPSCFALNLIHTFDSSLNLIIYCVAPRFTHIAKTHLLFKERYKTNIIFTRASQLVWSYQMAHLLWWTWVRVGTLANWKWKRNKMEETLFLWIWIWKNKRIFVKYVYGV